MATNTEIQGLFINPDLIIRIKSSMVKAANTILKSEDTADPPYDQGADAAEQKALHELRVVWAAQALDNDARISRAMLKEILAEEFPLTRKFEIVIELG